VRDGHGIPVGSFSPGRLSAHSLLRIPVFDFSGGGRCVLSSECRVLDEERRSSALRQSTFDGRCLCADDGGMDERDELLADGGGIDVQFSDVSYSVTVWTPGKIFGPGRYRRRDMVNNIIAALKLT